MVIYLRDEKGQKNIAECEITGEVKKAVKVEGTNRYTNVSSLSIYSHIDIVNYTVKLLSIPYEKQKGFIKAMESVDKLPQWYYETKFSHDPDYTKDDIIKEIKEKLSIISKEFNLKLVED